MATIKEIQLKNTNKFLEGYTQKMVDLAKIEIGRKRRRVYESGRVVNSPINSSGDGRRSLGYTKSKEGFSISGNDYLEKVDEGTDSTIVSPQQMLNWIKYKPVRIRDSKGRILTMTDYRRKNLARLLKEKLELSGIKKTNFLTDLIEGSMDRLNGIEDAFVDDIIDGLEDLLIDLGFIKEGESYKLEKK